MITTHKLMSNESCKRSTKSSYMATTQNSEMLQGSFSSGMELLYSFVEFGFIYQFYIPKVEK